MITNNGKEIIAKYLLGQAPAFATHIAAGIGVNALSPSGSASYDPTQKALAFEAFRVPISSKGFVKESGVEKVVFKAEMPTDQRFQITEVGIFPAQSNSIAGKYDSKLLITFSPAESWSYVHNGAASAVPLPPALGLDQNNSSSDIDITDKITFINSDSTIFNNNNRKNRNEPPRFLNKALMVVGDSSDLDASFVVSGSPYYLENSNISFDLSQNLPTDEIKLALSVISKTATTDSNPDVVRVLIEFINNVTSLGTSSPKAYLRMDLTDEDMTEGDDSIRYAVISRTLSQFIKDSDFSFANVNLIKIYVSALVSGTPSSNFYVVLDGMRIDNISTLNPLYSLIGYTVIETPDGLPVLKAENTNNYIEYRFGIGVDG